MIFTMIVSISPACSFEALAAPVLQLAPGQASYPLGKRVEYFEDRSGQFDVMSIRQQPESAWKASEDDVPGFGFSRSAVWFRISLAATQAQKWLLEIDQPLLDEIALYQFAGGYLLQQVQTGDTLPYIDRPVRHRGFVIPMMIPASELTTLYLRVRTTGSLQLPMTLWSSDAFHDHEEAVMSVYGIYFGIILSMLLYNLFLYLRVLEPAYIYYVLYVLMFGLFIADLNGWGYKYLWPEAVAFQQYGLAIFIILGGVFVCRFVHYFLDLPRHAPQAGRLLDVFVVLMLALLCLLPLISYHIIVQVALAMIMLIALVSLYCGMCLWRRGELIAQYFSIAWSTFLVAVLLATLAKFGVLPRTFWTESFLPIGMALEVILLSLALGERINSEKQRRIHAQNLAIELHEKGRAELEKKVEERTNQLQEANARLRQLAVTDGLTGIFNYRHFVELGSHSIKMARRYQRPVAMIMLDIDRFKQVNDTHGHAAGDQVLRQMCAVCSRMKRETDIFGRLGGEEFGILLLGASAARAHEVAERMRCEIESLPIKHEGADIRITVSMGVYAIEQVEPLLTIEHLLKLADKGLYQAKQAGRNRVVMAEADK